MFRRQRWCVLREYLTEREIVQWGPYLKDDAERMAFSYNDTKPMPGVYTIITVKEARKYYSRITTTGGNPMTAIERPSDEVVIVTPPKPIPEEVMGPPLRRPPMPMRSHPDYETDAEFFIKMRDEQLRIQKQNRLEMLAKLTEKTKRKRRTFWQWFFN